MQSRYYDPEICRFISANFSGIPAVEASAVASAYTMSYDNTIEFLGMTININAKLHCGTIGAGAELDFKDGKFKIIPPSYGIVPDLSIDFD